MGNCISCRLARKRILRCGTAGADLGTSYLWCLGAQIPGAGLVGCRQQTLAGFSIAYVPRTSYIVPCIEVVEAGQSSMRGQPQRVCALYCSVSNRVLRLDYCSCASNAGSTVPALQTLAGARTESLSFPPSSAVRWNGERRLIRLRTARGDRRPR
jgi:hypothetical protein